MPNQYIYNPLHDQDTDDQHDYHPVYLHTHYQMQEHNNNNDTPRATGSLFAVHSGFSLSFGRF